MKDIIIRAVKTGLQAFLAAWAITGNSIDKNVLLGAAAAGVSTAMNILLNARK